MKFRKNIAATILAITTIAIGLTGCNTASNSSSTQSESNQSSQTSERVIQAVSREDGSGTRSAFIELTGILQDGTDRTTPEATFNNSTSVMMATVAGNVDAIGYISMGSLNDTVKAVSVDGVAATVENVASGTYALQRPFNIATKEGTSEVAQDFIKFMMSAEGQKVAVDNGYISVGEGEAYTASGIKGDIVVAGSSSVTPLMEKLKEAYIALNADVTIEIQQSDSSTGMTAAADGICDIGMASRDLKQSELDKGLTGLSIARDGIAVIVNKDNAVSDLTREEITTIYTSDKITWESLGK